MRKSLRKPVIKISLVAVRQGNFILGKIVKLCRSGF
jgi:hypothetical protein